MEGLCGEGDIAGGAGAFAGKGAFVDEAIFTDDEGDLAGEDLPPLDFLLLFSLSPSSSESLNLRIFRCLCDLRRGGGSHGSIFTLTLPSAPKEAKFWGSSKKPEKQPVIFISVSSLLR